MITRFSRGEFDQADERAQHRHNTNTKQAWDMLTGQPGASGGK